MVPSRFFLIEDPSRLNVGSVPNPIIYILNHIIFVLLNFCNKVTWRACGFYFFPRVLGNSV